MTDTDICLIICNRAENYNRETQSLAEGVKSHYFTIKFVLKVINLLWSRRIFPGLSIPIQMNGFLKILLGVGQLC